MYSQGLSVPSMPPAPTSSHQNPNFSTNNYGPEADLYNLAYLMQHIVRHSPIYVHPDPDFNKLSEDLKDNAEGCDIAYALNLAETKYGEMTGYV